MTKAKAPGPFALCGVSIYLTDCRDDRKIAKASNLDRAGGMQGGFTPQSRLK